MDEYTRETKKWLDKRYLWVDENKIYIAHEPIYGLRKGHCEHAILFRYMITYRLLRVLSHIQFESLLDVGGGEGYKAALIKRIYRVNVKSCELSEEACKRAEEIFQISSDTADIHQLPYSDHSFDIVLCSEALEHVTNWKKALDELIRISKKAVILTLPHESEQFVQQNRQNQIMASHIHRFNNNSFDFLKGNQYDIKTEKIYSSLLTIPCILVEATHGPYYNYRKHSRTLMRKVLRRCFDLFIPIFRNILHEKVASWIIHLDDRLTRYLQFVHYSGMLFVILKDPKSYTKKSRKKIYIDQVLNFSVPYHYLNQDRC
ncbi:class I SAM-dependent methyltransferase [candidate division TA06 bacterium]|nr:class I SAM-dependent methyltransferase [candidate division TA06 bacterium]